MDRNYSEAETVDIAQALLADIAAQDGAATIVGLTGNLGAGKTTLVKSIAKILGVSEIIISPTFVIAKFYDSGDDRWQHLVHVDAYRIEDIGELAPLGWQEIVQSPNTLVIVEWPERIASALPSNTQHFRIAHTDTKRHITRI
jgi:tRNA threonylcarbamoyladenosine biosynthesis protein TsaE